MNMALDLLSVVLTAARFGHKRYGTRGAIAFGALAGGAYYLLQRRRRSRGG